MPVHTPDIKPIDGQTSIRNSKQANRDQHSHFLQDGIYEYI